MLIWGGGLLLERVGAVERLFQGGDLHDQEKNDETRLALGSSWGEWRDYDKKRILPCCEPGLGRRRSSSQMRSRLIS